MAPFHERKKSMGYDKLGDDMEKTPFDFEQALVDEFIGQKSEKGDITLSTSPSVSENI